MAVRQPLEAVLAQHGHARRRHQRYLLGLAALQGDRAGDAVDVAVAGRFRCRGIGRRRHGHGHFHARVGLFLVGRRPLVHLAGHQPQRGAGVVAVGGVGQGDQRREVEPIRRRVEPGHVVGTPGQAVGQVVEAQVAGSRLAGENAHQQGRLAAQPGRHAGEGDAARRVDLDAVADLHHQAPGQRQHPRLLHLVGAGLGMGADDLHGLAERSLQQAPGRQEVGHQALLDDAQAGRAQQHGLRLHLAADALDGEQGLAGRQVDAARLADQAEVLVVDREDQGAAGFGAERKLLGPGRARERGRGQQAEGQSGSARAEGGKHWGNAPMGTGLRRFQRASATIAARLCPPCIHSGRRRSGRTTPFRPGGAPSGPRSGCRRRGSRARRRPARRGPGG